MLKANLMPLHRIARPHLEHPSSSDNFHRMHIHPMHVRWKTTITTVQATNPTHRTLSRFRERALMAINTLRIVASMPSLTRSLSSNHAKPLKLLRSELVMVIVRTFVLFSSVPMAASLTDIVLIARLQLLDALHLVAIVLELGVKTLSMLVALDRIDRLRRGTRQVGEWLMCILRCNS